MRRREAKCRVFVDESGNQEKLLTRPSSFFLCIGVVAAPPRAYMDEQRANYRTADLRED